MFLSLLRVLLWVLLLALAYFVVAKFIPKVVLAFLGGILLVLIVGLSFYNPNNILVLPTWETISFPFKPVGLSLILFLLGITKIKKDHITKDGKIMIISGLVILFLSSTPILAYELAKNMEIEGAGIKPIPAQCLNQTDPDIIADQDFLDCYQYLLPSQDIAPAIVLLGKDTTQPNLPYHTRVELEKTGDRILYTAQLYKQQVDLGNFPIIIISAPPRGDFQGSEESLSESIDIAVLLQDLGVDPAQIVLEPKGYDLRTSAQETKRILTERNLQTQPILLVTSGISMRRATLTFRNLGLDIKPRPANLYGFQSTANSGKKLRVKDFLPSASALDTTTEVVEEFLATIYYFLRGWSSPSIS
jgi:uncharacterized SAM-binding protein YcdF (DUF218 family)